MLARTLLFFCVTILLPLGIAAQDHSAIDGQHGRGHAENHDWYKDLRQPGTGYSCCNGTFNGIDGD